LAIPSVIIFVAQIKMILCESTIRLLSAFKFSGFSYDISTNPPTEKGFELGKNYSMMVA
jgi:hypothetical protein